MENILNKIKECFLTINHKANDFGFYKTYTNNICKISYDLAKERKLNENVVVLALFFSVLDEIQGNNIEIYKNKIKNFFNQLYKTEINDVLKVLKNYKEDKKTPETVCINDAKFIISYENFKKIYIKYVNEANVPSDVKTKFSIIKSLYFKSSNSVKEKYRGPMMNMLYYFKRAIITKQESLKQKIYKVVAKCGHVGQGKYYPGDFIVKATNASDAAEKVRYMPRVKHDNKYAILSVEEIDEKTARRIFLKKEKEIYFYIKTKKQRKQAEPLIRRLLVEEEKMPYETRKTAKSNKNTSRGERIRNYKKYIKYNPELEKDLMC